MFVNDDRCYNIIHKHKYTQYTNFTQKVVPANKHNLNLMEKHPSTKKKTMQKNRMEISILNEITSIENMYS